MVYAACFILLILYGCDAMIVKKTEQECQEDSKKIGGDKNKYVEYFEDCISEYYHFDPSADQKMWKKVPTLENVLAESHFKKAALVAEEFFLNGGKKRKWEDVHALWLDPDEACKKMLHVTAARYIYYTYKLVELSKPKAFGMCKTQQGQGNDGEKKYVLPEFSCYPENAGSKRCTSDADVGLVGPGSGTLVSEYNKFIKEKFGMTSEELFDNNMYGYSIEMAMPEVFVAAPGKEGEYEEVKKYLARMDDDVHYQMQDLVFAYYKVYIHGFQKADEFNLAYRAKISLDDNYNEQFKYWYDTYVLNLKVMKNRNIDDKDSSNNMYSWLVEFMAGLSHDKGKPDLTKALDTKMSFLLVSHVYASEAYLTRGALRVVVGAQQMNRESVKKRLTPLDHWCTMVENYGDTMKEYKRECEKPTATTGSCLLKLSKYVKRCFDSAEQLYKSLENNNIAHIKNPLHTQEKLQKLKSVMDNFGKKEPDVRATDILKHWIDDFKNRAIKDIKNEYDASESPKLKNKGKKDWKGEFFKLIGCDYKKDDKFPEGCMEQISAIIEAFNERMVYFTNTGKVAKQNCIDNAC